MSTVSEVIAVLESIAPPSLAESWDNVGLLIGDDARTVDSVLTCLTLTSDVAAEAIRSGVDLIVSHHPVLFRGTKAMTTGSREGEMLLSLIQSNIAVYSPHTSFDSAAKGINHRLSVSLGVQQPIPLRPIEQDPSLGSGRWGRLHAARELPLFLSTVRKVTQTPYVEYSGEASRMVQTIAVACGSAGEFLSDAIRLGCDAFVTGEARFHTVLEARDAGIALVITGHYASERPAVEELAIMLDAALEQVTVCASRVETDPLQLFGGES